MPGSAQQQNKLEGLAHESATDRGRQLASLTSSPDCLVTFAFDATFFPSRFHFFLNRVNLAAANLEAPAAAASLSELENEVIAFFVDTVRWFGAPKSLGAIYGLLFISAEPISFEQIANRLQMSNGSVSQGLKILKDLGAVKVTFKPGERRDFFVAEMQLRQLARGFLRQSIERPLLNGESRLSELLERTRPEFADESVSSTFIEERLRAIKRWQTQARDIIPVLLKVLEASPG